MVVKIIKFRNQKNQKISYSNTYHGYNKQDTFACLDCGIKYVIQNMMSYSPPNRLYHKKDTELYCIRCYNKKFS